MKSKYIRYEIPLLPFIEKRKEDEIQRAANARKHKKVKSIPIRFPSVNTMYPINPRLKRKYPSKECETYKAHIDECLMGFDFPQFNMYDVTYVFYMTHEMMFTKAGELSNNDVSNYLKGTEDALFDWMLESDKLVMTVRGCKRLTSNDPKVIILVSESDATDFIYHRDHVFDPYELETAEVPCGKILQ